MPRVAAQSAQNADALLREVVHLFHQAQRSMTECCSDATAKECQALLLVGSAESPLTVQEFADRMSLEKTWASRLVARLEKRGLVTRVDHPDDGRSWLIELTAKGRKEHSALENSLNQHAVNLLGCVPASERANVERALVHLRDALARCLVECAPGTSKKSSC
ncbi:MAG: MarR family transcriptional regulator [Opitutae bacterium]|nr:MarR family transcriptional regulator [Opitutae bacterium]